MTRTTQDFAAFLESLKVKNDGPEEMHGIRFDAPLSEEFNNHLKHHTYVRKAFEYLYERLRRAESNTKPETLAEDVKAYMRAYHESFVKAADNADNLKSWCEFRKLCMTPLRNHKQLTTMKDRSSSISL